MPSKRPTTLWAAQPHTLAKLEILRSYLTAYFAILGIKAESSREILYVDGFAGPNEYTDHAEGSPTVAVKAAGDAIRQAGNRWRARGVNCVFIDEKGWIADHCRKKLVELPANPRVKHQVLEGRFSEVLPKLVQEYPRHFQGDWPLFV